MSLILQLRNELVPSLDLFFQDLNLNQQVFVIIFTSWLIAYRVGVDGVFGKLAVLLDESTLVLPLVFVEILDLLLDVVQEGGLGRPVGVQVGVLGVQGLMGVGLYILTRDLLIQPQVVVPAEVQRVGPLVRYFLLHLGLGDLFVGILLSVDNLGLVLEQLLLLLEQVISGQYIPFLLHERLLILLSIELVDEEEDGDIALEVVDAVVLAYHGLLHNVPQYISLIILYQSTSLFEYSIILLIKGTLRHARISYKY